MRLEPKTNEYIAAKRMAAVVRLDRVWERVSGEVCADACFDESEQRHVARVAEGISADAKRAAIEKVEVLLDVRLASEQFVLVDQFGTARDKVLAGDRKNGFNQVGIQITERRGSVVPSPDKGRGPASAGHRLDVLQGSRRTHLIP